MKEHTVTAAQMKQIERAADAAGLSYRQMMENAGCRACESIRRRCPTPQTAVVFAGKGNNGGDGFVVARLLAQEGARVRVILCEGAPVTEDAIYNFEQLAGVEIWPFDEIGEVQEAEVLACDIVVDALYGTGFHGALRPSGLRAADMMNRAAGQVCALDLPSGLNGGHRRGGAGRGPGGLDGHLPCAQAGAGCAGGRSVLRGDRGRGHRHQRGSGKLKRKRTA